MTLQEHDLIIELPERGLSTDSVNASCRPKSWRPLNGRRNRAWIVVWNIGISAPNGPAHFDEIECVAGATRPYSRSAAASSIATMRAAVVLVVVVAFLVVVGMLRAAEVVLVDIRPDVASQIGAGLLIEAKMDASVDARVADIVRDLVEPGVVEGYPPARRGSPS